MKGGQRVLTIIIGATPVYDETLERFRDQGGFELQLEHSLKSLSKWESEFEKPFLGESEKTPEEAMAYIRCMVLTQNPPEDFLDRLSHENIEVINEYIKSKMTATWFSETPGMPKSREIVTSELIYYWMISFNIPVEFENWHLNRLITLIRVCSLKNAKPQKMSRSEIAQRNREINARRRAQLGSKG
jgi:hypothetical protein